MSSILQYPPQLLGTNTEQLAALRRYLILLVSTLNDASGETTQTIVQTQKSVEAAATASDTSAGELKSLIQKNAVLVEREIEQIEQTLTSSYVAKSDYGIYQEQVSAQLTAMPETVKQAINYTAILSDITGLQAYRTETQGYIKSGIVDWEADGETPIIGIAIGQNLTYTSRTAEKYGKTYTEIDKREFSSVFTAEKLCFYIGDSCVAYFSNNALYITDATVTGKLHFSGDWTISHTDGFSIKWTGA